MKLAQNDNNKKTLCTNILEHMILRQISELHDWLKSYGVESYWLQTDRLDGLLPKGLSQLVYDCWNMFEIILLNHHKGFQKILTQKWSFPNSYFSGSLIPKKFLSHKKYIFLTTVLFYGDLHKTSDYIYPTWYISYDYIWTYKFLFLIGRHRFGVSNV